MNGTSNAAPTLSGVADRAKTLRALLADDEWVEDEPKAKEVKAHIHGLVLEIIGLPLRPVGQKLSMDYRLARAEAERLHGRCRRFELAIEGSWSRRNQPETRTNLNRNGGELFVGLGAYLAMAEGL